MNLLKNMHFPHLRSKIQQRDRVHSTENSHIYVLCSRWVKIVKNGFTQGSIAILTKLVHSLHALVPTALPRILALLLCILNDTINTGWPAILIYSISGHSTVEKHWYAKENWDVGECSFFTLMIFHVLSFLLELVYWTGVLLLCLGAWCISVWL